MAQLSEPLGLRPKEASGLRANILLVDDNPANLQALGAILDDLDQDLVEARSGEEALIRLGQDDFAVVLLDVQMPGLGGFGTAKLIRSQERSRHTPIIFVTAHEDDQLSAKEAYKLGAVDYLTKPLEPLILRAKVAGFIDLFQKTEQIKQQAEQLRQRDRREFEERLAQENARLHESERLVWTLTRFAPVGIFQTDAVGNCLFVNERWCEMAGLSQEEAQGQGWVRALHPEDRQRIAQEWNGAAEAGREFSSEYRFQTPQGKITWLHGNAVLLRNDAGKVTGYIGTVTNITERRQAEQALLETQRELENRVSQRTSELVRANEFMKALLENVQTGIVACDAAGVLTLFNTVTRDLHGMLESPIPPEQWAARYRLFRQDGHTPMEKEEVPLFRALQGERVRDAEMVIAPVGAPPRTVLTSGQAFYDAKGVKLGAVVSMHDITVRKQAEAALRWAHDELERRVVERTKELGLANAELRESEEKLRLMANTIPQLAWMARPDGDIFWYNRRWYEYTGTTPDQMEGWGWQSVHDPDVLPKVLERWKASLASGEPFDMVFPLRGSDGVLRPFLTRVMPLRAESGRILYWFGTNTDITELKEARESLATSEERLRLALEAGRMGVWDWNIRTGEIKWSDSLEPLHGLPPGQFDGTFDAFQKLIHPADRAMVNNAIQQAVEKGSGYDIEFRNVWPNGSIHWISGKGKVYAGEDAQPGRMIGVGMDVTQRKRSEQTARFLADASATLAVLVDFDSTLQKVASLAVPNFADWATVDLAEVDGSLRRVAVAHVDPAKVELAHYVHWRFPPDPTAPQGVWNILRTGESEIVPEITDELRVQSIKDDELLGIMRELGLKSFIGVPLKVRGKTMGVITFIAAESGHRYDDTDLAVAQDLADRAAIAIENAQLYAGLREADRRKDEFLATLAHELRNPLAPIRNSLQVLKMPRVDASIAQQTREMMERQVHHLVRLVDDLLDVSRVMRGKIELRKESVELASVVARAMETAQPLIEAQGHELTITLPPESLLMNADPIRLAQVVGNLLTNAAKYTESNGRIWLTAQREGGEVVLRVRDNGIGIAPDMLPHIFELFVQVDHAATRSQGGLGIGLTLVKSLVEKHNGTIQARSDGLGQGSEFSVRLPLSALNAWEPSEKDNGEQQSATSSSGHRLLVIDDNKDAANSLALLLRLQGHEVRVAHSGPAALEIVKVDRPEMVFLDIGMPGMDGYEVARRMRQQPGLEKVLLAALTGWGQKEDRRRTAEAGFDHHLVKPPDPGALQALIDTLAKPK